MRNDGASTLRLLKLSCGPSHPSVVLLKHLRHCLRQWTGQSHINDNGIHQRHIMIYQEYLIRQAILVTPSSPACCTYPWSVATESEGNLICSRTKFLEDCSSKTLIEQKLVKWRTHTQNGTFCSGDYCKEGSGLDFPGRKVALTNLSSDLPPGQKVPPRICWPGNGAACSWWTVQRLW